MKKMYCENKKNRVTYLWLLLISTILNFRNIRRLVFQNLSVDLIFIQNLILIKTSFLSKNIFFKNF